MRLENADWPMIERDQLLVVCDPGRLGPLLRGRYSQFNVTVSPTYLAGIAALANRPTRGLLVGIDPGARKLDSAIAGLRKAAGDTARIVLCCHPGGEPAARRVLKAGANDYVIYPPRGEELDHALGLPTAGPGPEHPIATADEAAPTWEELNGLAHVLAGIADGRQAMLERLCQWIADSMRSADVRIVAGRESASVGDPEIDPALSEIITAGGRRLGQILVGPRQKSPFSTGEVEKLRHYGRMIAHLLDAAEQQRRWQSLALVDQVTQLPNRRYLMKAMDQLLQRAAQQRFRVTVLLFDLDGFKHFNDTYGHAAGDATLRETGQLFRRHCRQHDIVARYGGDEFVVVFWDAEEPRIAGSRHPTDVLAMLRRIKQALQAHAFPKLGPEVTGCITISGGLASFPWDARDAQGLIERADEALLEAKRAGKNRIHLVGTKSQPVENPPDNTEDTLD
jgi:diguanylate cyclase (GGDEF)-like protein